MTDPISNERLAEMPAEVEIEFDNALSDAEADQNPQLAVDPVGEFDLIELRSILTELQTRRQSPARMEVKPLEWGTETEARSLIGTYHILKGRVRLVVMLDGKSIPDPFFGTIGAAKAAAQADYERRILSSLSVKEPEGVPVAKLRKVAEEAFWLLAWTFQSHLHRHGEPFDMSIFAPEARDLMNKGEQDLFDALSALPSEAHNGQ